MHAIGAVLERPERVAESEAAVVVPVPVDADLRARARDDAARELNEVADAVGRRVADRVREDEAARAVVDRRAKERRQHVGPRSRRVLGDVRDGEARLDGDVDRLGAALRDQRHVPLLDELANRARPDERADLDAETRALADLDDRRDVGDDRAAGAADLDVHLAVDDLLAEPEHVVERALAAAGQADVRVLDAEIFHQVQDAQLVVDRRVLDARVLQAVAQRLVDQREGLGHEPSLSIELVPIENKVAGTLRVRGCQLP